MNLHRILILILLSCIPCPSCLGTEEDVTALVARGRGEYLAGDTEAAERTFKEVCALDAHNATGEYFLTRIEQERERTRSRMLAEVDQAWRRPEAAVAATEGNSQVADVSPLWRKLNDIVVTDVTFSGMELDRVVQMLSAISRELDHTGLGYKGINFVLLDRSGASPSVNLTLRGLSLKRVLDFVTDSVGYQYEVQADAIVIRPGGEVPVLETRFFPISRSTALRMMGKLMAAGSQPTAGSAGTEGDGPVIRNFLQMAGVNFNEVPGSTLAFDGSQLIVTQSARNLERIRNILARYRVVRQVEIEAKFMEVQEGALEELGFQWHLSSRTGSPGDSQTRYTSGSGVMSRLRSMNLDSLAILFNQSALNSCFKR